METKKDKLLEKLRKLMNLKESATSLGNKGEANAAAAGITRLLMEYNLTEEDIPAEEKLKNPIVMEMIPYKTEVSGSWYSALISTLCEFNMCRPLILCTPSYSGRSKRDKFEIIGRKKNVEVVLYLISFLLNQFIMIGKRDYSSYKHACIWQYDTPPKSLNAYLKSFLYGCVMGLHEKFKEEKKRLEDQSDITALVCTTQSEIDDFLKDTKTSKTRKSKAEIDSLCAMQGMKVGKNVEISKGIHSDTANEKFRLQ